MMSPGQPQDSMGYSLDSGGYEQQNASYDGSMGEYDPSMSGLKSLRKTLGLSALSKSTNQNQPSRNEID